MRKVEVMFIRVSLFKTTKIVLFIDVEF
jgi:hypothetical protein